GRPAAALPHRPLPPGTRRGRPAGAPRVRLRTRGHRDRVVRPPAHWRAGCLPRGSDRVRGAGASADPRGAALPRLRPRRRARSRHLSPMSLIVQKYGGTSVADVERIRNVARRVRAGRGAGHDLVVVVSAMAGETNRLLALAKDTCPEPDRRESDVLV